MILRVEDKEYLPDEKDNSILQGVKIISVETLNNKKLHPWILAGSWDSVLVKLDKNINVGYVKQILMKVGVIQAIIPKDIVLGNKILDLLTVIYPSLASRLQDYYCSGDIELLFSLLKQEGAYFE